MDSPFVNPSCVHVCAGSITVHRSVKGTDSVSVKYLHSDLPQPVQQSGGKIDIGHDSSTSAGNMLQADSTKSIHAAIDGGDEVARRHQHWRDLSRHFVLHTVLDVIAVRNCSTEYPPLRLTMIVMTLCSRDVALWGYVYHRELQSSLSSSYPGGSR